MANVFKLRVIIDTEEDVFRDIELTAQSTFHQLHETILQSFQFEKGEMASFYLSNDEWEKGLEIPLMDMGEGVVSMENALLSEMLQSAGNKVLYVYDFLRMWIFYIEVIEVLESDANQVYPLVSLTFGEAPSQDSKEMEAMFDDGKWEEEEKWDAASGDEDEDEFGFNDDENFDADDFDGYYDER
jgi:hypothetical protein